MYNGFCIFPTLTQLDLKDSVTSKFQLSSTILDTLIRTVLILSPAIPSLVKVVKLHVNLTILTKL